MQTSTCAPVKNAFLMLQHALNDLPPKYVVTEKGELYSKINTLEQQFEVDVVAAITKAAVLVKRRPRHI